MSRGMTIRRDKRGEDPVLRRYLIIVAGVVFLVLFLLLMRKFSGNFT